MIFGTFQFEEGHPQFIRTVLEDGKISENANPWAKRWVTDIVALCEASDEGQTFLEESQENMRALGGMAIRLTATFLLT